ncbi:MAG TPA: preprotein translocase subunit SecG [Candidatus Cybelea sp.]|nr:preprotein translocase subunit SecG [Candidatus Cybelea sp.]
MQTALLIVHVLIAIALVGVVLLQRSEGGALGIGGGGGLMTGRGAANLLTRTTAVLAALFFLTSIALGTLAGSSHRQRSILDATPQAPATSAPAPPGGTAPANAPPATAPAQPAQPSVPLSR